ncbi:MAG: T9SS type A sorting domain-containing protein, partial [Saprospiraceae bacterium]|nr:T9SS type A sorting domain-containing protein [Candidatus Opimibacter skivensis]
TILNDDTVNLTLSGGGSANEGNSGTNPRVFNVTLSAGVQSGLVDPNGHPRGTIQAVQGGFTVAYFTNDGTATTADNDYVDNDGTLTFNGDANETHQITVLVNGDLNIENNETFTVTIGAITNSTPVQIAAITEVGSPQTGTIVNDELDWGDAPTAAQSGFAGTYPTFSADNGARHNLVPNGLHLGTTVDADLDGQPSATATGDGADEDGVTMPAALVINTSQSITVNSSGTGFLYGWFDWNRDGDWADAGEFVYLGTGLSAGNNALTLNVPAGASLGLSYARFRVTDSNQGSSFSAVGLAPGVGEVEDYQVNIVNTQFNIDNPSVVEGNAGTTNLVFTISRTNNSTACSVNYAITGGTATTADLDYQVFAGGTASFTQGGALSQTVTVVVNGDLKVELDETVIMTLSNPVNGAIQNGTGTGTITNDDSGVITITSPSIVEGDAGTQNLVFNINMSAISDANAIFNFATANGTATAGSDYVANSGTITLTPGQTTATVTVVINGDCTIEPNEIFTVVLSALNANGRNITFSPAGATLAGTGTIINEDFLPVITFCPANTTISCEASTLPANTGTATATDDCPGVVVTSTDAIVQGNCVNNYTINRTWKATDNTNDMATCLQTITVRDITPPTISCPGNVTVTCASEVPFPNVEGAFMTSDNCGGGVFISFVSDAIINQVCTNRFQVARTYRATDACGNSATCQQTITVFDNIAPQLNCPAPQTFQCASDVPAPNPALVTSTDNCAGGSTATFVNDVVTNQTCANKFTLTRTYRATDACGNSATCTQVFTVNDNTVPQLTCPAGITVQCASLIPAPNVALVTATDNCSGIPTVTFVSDVNSNVICVNKFTVTRTYRATDLCGNSATCTQTIIVNDNTVPTLTCPVNVTVQCASLVPAVNTAGVVTADNCGPVPTVTFVNDVISNQTCTNRFVVTRTYRSTDACGNSATCAQVITVFDNTAPTLTCPANVTVQCATLVPAVNTAGVVTADNCGAIPTVTFVSDVISNLTCINRFVVTRTYRSTDECGNSATCAQIITVFDNTAPVITFTDPLIANLANGGRFDVQCHGQDPNWSLPVLGTNSVSTTDNCNGAVTVTFSQILQAQGNCPVDGYITLYKLTWTATDVCGNSSTKFVFMALVDHIAPTLFNIPTDITVNCDEIPDPPTNVYATDECVSAMNIQYVATPVSAGCQNGQVINRSWIATDECGNKSTGTQHIHLIDVKPPVLQILQPELAGVGDGAILKYTCSEGGIPQWYDDLNAESVYSPPSCGSAVTIKFEKNTIHAVNCKRAGYREQQTYHWHAVDVCGNATDLTIIAQLIDTEAPVIHGVPDTACVDDLAFKFVEATDDCGEAFLRYWDTKIPNPCGNGTAFMRTYEAYDNCGNFTRDTAILIPNDHVGPVMKFVNPKLANLPPGEVLLIDCEGQAGDYTPYGVGDVSVQDGCSGVTVTFHEKVLESHGCTNGIVATLSLEWTATDICGNMSTLTVPAFVVDHTSPVLVNFKTEVTIGCKDTLPSINATDNCGAVTINITQSSRPGPCEFEYDITRIITATDPCGNVTTATQIVHVGDGSGPIISGVVPELCDDLSIPEVTAFDPCSGKNVPVTMTEKQLDSQCRDGKVFERTWTATDACGNVSTVKQIIIVGDKTPPEIQIPTWSIILKYLNAPGKSFVNLSETDIIDKLNDLDDGSVYVTDECDLQVVPQFTLEVTYSENCAAEGYFEHRVYTWTATDICGNSSSVSFDVYIMDDIPPVLIGVPKDATIICAQLPAVPFVSSPDPAQPVSIVYTQTILPGNGAGVFNVTRTWTGKDACGNVTTESQHITWIPDTFLDCQIIIPQLVECNSHGVVISSNVTGGLGGYTYNWEIIGQGFIQSGQGTNQITIYVGWTELTIILNITDGYGCTTSCSTAFQCLDTAINPYVGDPQTTDPTTINDQGQSPVPDNESAPVLSKVSLWPNPVNGNVNLSFTSHANQEVKYRLINFLGQVMLSDKIDARKGPNTQKVNVSGIPEGSYLIEMKTEKEVYTKVIVVMRHD